MSRADMYDTRREMRRSGGTYNARDIETWLGNSLATILAGLAVASGVIGLLVAFGYINKDATDSFNDGMIWMVGGLILGICANVFRREHHIADFGERPTFGEGYRSESGKPEYRERERERPYEEPVERGGRRP